MTGFEHSGGGVPEVHLSSTPISDFAEAPATVSLPESSHAVFEHECWHAFAYADSQSQAIA